MWNTWRNINDDDDDDDNNNNNNVSIMDLGHLLNRSGRTRLTVSVMVSPGFCCLLVCSFLVLSVIWYGTISLYVASSFFCSAVFCLRLGLCLVLLQSVFYKLPTCVVLFLSYISMVFSVAGVVVPRALHKCLTLQNMTEGISNSQMMAWNIAFVREFRSSRTINCRTFNYFDKTCNYKLD